MTPREELVELGQLYGVPVAELIATHGAALDRYAEWVLGRDDFAVVTLGDVATLSPLAREPAASRFVRAARRWPGAITGVKLEVGSAREPTLYVRTTCPWDDALAMLATEVPASVVAMIPRARTLYGLGFQGDVIKTYALTDDGFVSHRFDADGVHREHKDYRAEVAWEDIAWPDARWQRIGALGRALAFRTAGHVGVLSSAPELKIYVERTGGIPTDRSLA